MAPPSDCSDARIGASSSVSALCAFSLKSNRSGPAKLVPTRFLVK